jgi:hypothetical protein
VYFCVLKGSQNKQRLFSYSALSDWFYVSDDECLLRRKNWIVYTIQISLGFNANLRGFRSLVSRFETEWHWHRFFYEYFGSLLPVSFHQYSILISICTFLLEEGRKYKAWELPKKQCSLGNRKTLDRRVHLFGFLLALFCFQANAEMVSKNTSYYCMLFMQSSRSIFISREAMYV